MSWDGITLGESYCPGMERLQGSPSVLEWNDSRGVLLSYDGKSPGESFCCSVVILSWDSTTAGESFCPGMEQLQGSHSVRGCSDSRGVHLSWVRTTPRESFCLGME